ncbi:MAG: ribonuclease J [Oscillospiraceae bacterium]
MQQDTNKNKNHDGTKKPKAFERILPLAAQSGAEKGAVKQTEEKKSRPQRNKNFNRPKAGLQDRKPLKKGAAQVKETHLSVKSRDLENKYTVTDRNASLRITPLGGLGEVGKNITVFECNGDSFIVDCGMGFPDDEMLGVDIVIPDFTYLSEIKDTLRGVIITHGHEDHIGAIPFFLKEINVPIYGKPLAIGLIGEKLKEHGIFEKSKLNCITTGQVVQFGCMSVEAIRVNHSIPDSIALAITTPAGVIVHTGDFKVDFTPVFDETIDLARFAEIGSKGVLALMSDSTNSERPGHSPTESKVGVALENLFARGEGKRILIATFSSNIQRIQQIIDLAKRHDRKIAFSGRSMENYTRIASELGYLSFDEDMIVAINDIGKVKPSDLIIITTGSQGEPMSALSRMASGSHKQVTISSLDLIIISATPIPGNEKMVIRVINELLKLGSDVIYESMYEVHASGHACQEEQKLIINLTRPKFFIPVHGEYKHLIKHAKTAEQMGIPQERIIIPEIGKQIEFHNGGAHFAGVVKAGSILVDGLGVGDVGSVVLRDRKHLSSDGLVVVVCSIDSETGELVSGPDIISRGFIYMRDSEALIDEAKALVRTIIDNSANKTGNKSDKKLKIREDLGKLMYQRTKRSPMILPVIMDI